jgi:hypothetical protein
VFVGPTLAADRVRELVPGARLHAPIRHGQVLGLGLGDGDVVAVIDGLFFQSAAVRHKELLHLLGKGVRVYGASSMGALRAAELGPFGMVGVGIVHALYARGWLDGDDEVAVVHGPAEEGYRPVSDALVTIRVGLRRARRAGAIGREQERALVQLAARLPFPERTFRRLLRQADQAAVPPPAIARLRAFLADHPQDVKREDAVRLLTGLRDGTLLLAPPPAAPHTTSFLARWLRASRGRRVDGLFVPDTAVLSYCQTFAPAYPRIHRRAVLEDLVRVERYGRVDPGAMSVADLEGAVLDACRARGLVDGDELPLPFNAWLDKAERQLPLAAAAARAVARSYRRTPNVRPVDALVAALRALPGWEDAVTRTAAALALNRDLQRRDARHRPSAIPASRVVEWCRRRWGVNDVRLAMLDRGFITTGDLHQRAGMFVPLATVSDVPDLDLTP